MAMPPAYHESLPYIDQDPSPASLAAAHALIAQATTTTAAPPPSSPPPGISKPTASAPLNLSHYQAQDVAPTCSVEALRSALENSGLAYTYLDARASNLALLDEHGNKAWLAANYHAEHLLAQLQAELVARRRDIDLVNARRMQRQQSVADELRALDEAWRKGVGRVVETELAVENLRQQIRDVLQARAGAHHEAQDVPSSS